MMRYSQYIADENAMTEFGARLMSVLAATESHRGIILFLNGDLGAGKTTLSRGMIQSFGHQGNVKSPTYTLVEEYHLNGKHIYHFDLYRLSDPEELEFMGIRDYFSADSICLLEWAEKGQGMLPPADLLVNISYADSARNLELIASSTLGTQILESLSSD